MEKRTKILQQLVESKMVYRDSSSCRVQPHECYWIRSTPVRPEYLVSVPIGEFERMIDDAINQGVGELFAYSEKRSYYSKNGIYNENGIQDPLFLIITSRFKIKLSIEKKKPKLEVVLDCESLNWVDLM